MSETETDLAWQIARGALPSPVRVGGFALFALRFSGTGTAWREAHNEHVFRPAGEYLTPEMCARIAGVPVVTLHPKAGNLDTQTYAQTVIGAIMFGYIAGPDGIENPSGDELWCIARVSDADAAGAMATGELSTSPAVVFAADSGNERIALSDGSHVLIENRAAIIDHLAACVGLGVWDRGSGPQGIRVDNQSESTMPDNSAANQGEMIDKLLKGLGDMGERLDAMSKRMDAMAPQQPAENDAAKRRADAAKARRDAEHAEWQREDAAACARDDAEEESEAERMANEGMAREVAADRAREMRRDKVAKRRADARLIRTAADAERERKEEGERADAQARADAAASAWGERAPPAMSGEDTLSYRKRLLRRFQKHSPTFRDADLGAVADAATLGGMETVIYADAVKASATPDFPDDELRYRTKVDPVTGHRITEGLGRRTFIHGLKRPSMRATAFLLPNGRAA